MKYNGLMLTDLDGTFLNGIGKISKANIEALNELHENKVACAVCTGRTLDAALEVVPPEIPFDYLVFSSGAGICEFPSAKVICRHELPQNDIIRLTEFFKSKQFDFSVHFPIPNNHHFYWFQGKDDKSPDLISRLHWLKEFASEGNELVIKKMQSATQFLAIAKDEQLDTINELKELFPHLSIIRATSPLTKGYSWIEVFPDGVSKGKGAEWLSNHLGVKRINSVSLGNDYNDIHMLEWTATSYIMDNSPDELKKRFKLAPSNIDDGFAVAVREWITNTFNG